MPVAIEPEIDVSFVHGFHDHVAVDINDEHPALWSLTPDGEETHSYHFPFTPSDFESLPYPLLGEMPRTKNELKRRPRYGFTGLAKLKDRLLAGSWNGIYSLNSSTKKVESFLSNRYSCYMHRFCADEQRIIFAMPFMDMVVIMSHAGEIIDRFMIDQSLRILRDIPDDEIDWRFADKPWSGPTGLFHINHVQTIGQDIYLTSRNLGALIVIRPGEDHASLRTLNYKTPTCVHDGDFVDGKFYLTSIDGKILVASKPQGFDPKLFRYDLQVECIRLDEVENNWCRGIEVTSKYIYTTIDGRYDSDLSFGLLKLDREYKLIDQHRFKWSNVGNVDDIRYVTGFDIVAQDHANAP
ncbi:MAG: hypothetical protein IH984_04230 [Planctomycetes bacterium]|nr:hypothetical protein [Planctomycetota bacterium]